MSTKSALIKFQRSILADLRSDVEQSIGRMPRPLQRYYDEYRREFFRFRCISSMSELREKIRACGIVYCGDYHSLRQAQMTNLQLLREIVKSRKLILATELVYYENQETLNHYLMNEIEEEKFLRTIHYEQTFGFDWQNYKPIFDFAREEKIPVLAIDYKDSDGKVGLYARDREMAKIIARAHLDQPDRLIWVMIGDLHLAQTHLPGFVEKELGKEKDRRILIVHQNNENLFWKVAHKGLRGNVEIIKMNDQVYCILNTAPWIKLQSYFSWLQNSEAEAVHDQFLRLVTSLCRFLKIEEAPLLDFAVYTANDSTFLREFEPHSKTYRYCKRRFERGYALLIPSKRIIYLPNPDVDLAAEMASRYIHTTAGNYRRRRGRWRDEFFRRICHNAIAYLGSRILNYHHGNIPLTYGALTTGNDPIKSCSRYGALLGQRIYEEMLADRIQVKDISQLFQDPFTVRGSAKRLYDRFLTNVKEL